MTKLNNSSGWNNKEYAPLLTQEAAAIFNKSSPAEATMRSITEVEQVKKPCFILENVLLKDDCKLLIELSEKIGYEDAEKFCYAYNDRYNDRLLSDDPILTELVWNRVKDFLPKQINFKGRIMNLEGLNSRWRLCKYKPGHYFNMHLDGSYVDYKKKTSSCLTLIIYLNSSLDGDYEGGSTIFYDSSLHLMKRKVKEPSGNVLIFLQSDKDMLHGGEKVYKGVKYIMRTDVMYSKGGDE